MNKREIKLSKGLHWYHWLVVISSLILTFIAWYVSHSQVQEKIEQRFEFQSSQLLALISERMSRYEDALRAGVATIHSQSQGIDVNEWHRFSEALHLEQTYPGINGIGVIYYVSPKALPDFLKVEHKYRPDFHIKPAHDKAEYWPITYVEPVALNLQAVGLDMAFEKNRLTAAKLARDTGETQITAPIILVQDEKKTPGFLQYVPFYKLNNLSSKKLRQDNFIGHVYAPFIMNKLMAGTLEQKNRRLLFSVYDNQDELYNELSTSTPGFDPSPLFKKEVITNMYGRSWRFTIQTAQSFRNEVSTSQPLFVLIGGLIIDTMLLMLFYMLSRSHSNAVEIATKMTEKLSASEHYYRHIIDSAPCGIAIVNNRGIIENINPQMETLFGYNEKELVGNNIDLLVPKRFRDRHSTYRANFALKPEKRKMGSGQEIFCLTKNEEEFPAEIGLASFKSDDNLKTIATVINISEYVQVTNELKRSNKELNDFAYVASHDLKAPLRGIMQLSSWIEEDITDFASKETKENLALLQSRTGRLDKLLDDLLEYSRVGRQNGEVKTIDIKLLITNIFDLLDPPKKLKLICQESLPTIDTYVAPLEIIFRNLLGNAIKHHDKSDGHVEFQMKELSDSFEFSISDNGPGISPSHHNLIFELFKTLKPRDEVEGSGMGLSIVNKILNSHGQTIKVLSDGKTGTCFLFTWFKSINQGIQ